MYANYYLRIAVKVDVWYFNRYSRIGTTYEHKSWDNYTEILRIDFTFRGKNYFAVTRVHKPDFMLGVKYVEREVERRVLHLQKQINETVGLVIAGIPIQSENIRSNKRLLLCLQ